jgi:hypothetical protein
LLVTFISGNGFGSQRRSEPAAGGVKKKEFTIKTMGELVDEDGVHLGFTLWQAPDGRSYTVIHNEFSSPLAAQEYLDKQTGKAIQVIKRGDARDSKGKIVGKRSEVTLGSKGRR